MRAACRPHFDHFMTSLQRRGHGLAQRTRCTDDDNLLHVLLPRVDGESFLIVADCRGGKKPSRSRGPETPGFESNSSRRVLAQCRIETMHALRIRMRAP